MEIVNGQKAVSCVMGDVVGVILAGGKSSRMGKNKAELVYNNHNLLEHMKLLFDEAGILKTYISGTAGISDVIADKGPLGGIHSVMQHLADNQEVIIAPVDMPLLSKEVLNILLEKQDKSDAVHFKRSIMPLKLKLSQKVRMQIARSITGTAKSLSIKKLLSNLKTNVIDIPPDTEQCFANINTPEDWQEIIKYKRETNEFAT